jgi:hypothetical protein
LPGKARAPRHVATSRQVNVPGYPLGLASRQSRVGGVGTLAQATASGGKSSHQPKSAGTGWPFDMKAKAAGRNRVTLFQAEAD